MDWGIRTTRASKVFGVEPRARGRASRAGAAPRIEAPETAGRQAAGEKGDRLAAWVEAHPREAAVVAAAVAVAGLVKTAGVPPLGALLALAVGGVALWAWRGGGRPAHRSKIEVVGGSRWPWRWHDFWWDRRVRGELGHVLGIWPWISERAGIPHSTITRAVGDPDEGYSLFVELARGQVIKDVHPDRLASALREFPHAILPGERAHQVVIRELLEDEPAPAVDELHDEPDDEPEVVLATPRPMDPHEERLARMRAVMSEAGEPLAGNRIAVLAKIPRNWVWKTGLPELERGGEVRQVNRKWILVSEVAA